MIHTQRKATTLPSFSSTVFQSTVQPLPKKKTRSSVPNLQDRDRKPVPQDVRIIHSSPNTLTRLEVVDVSLLRPTLHQSLANLLSIARSGGDHPREDVRACEEAAAKGARFVRGRGGDGTVSEGNDLGEGVADGGSVWAEAVDGREEVEQSGLNLEHNLSAELERVNDIDGETHVPPHLGSAHFLEPRNAVCRFERPASRSARLPEPDRSLDAITLIFHEVRVHGVHVDAEVRNGGQAQEKADRQAEMRVEAGVSRGPAVFERGRRSFPGEPGDAEDCASVLEADRREDLAVGEAPQRQG